jgi:hypothetical protein
MKKLFLFFIISYLFIKCDDNNSQEEIVYKYIPIYEYNCEYGMTEITKANCTGVDTGYSESQNLFKCCYVTYKNKTSGESGKRCKIIEDSEYGLKLYKHVLSSYEDVEIICKENYKKINNILILILLILFSL